MSNRWKGHPGRVRELRLIRTLCMAPFSDAWRPCVLIIAIVGMMLCATLAVGAPVTIVENGQAKAAIVCAEILHMKASLSPHSPASVRTSMPALTSSGWRQSIPASSSMGIASVGLPSL